MSAARRRRRSADLQADLFSTASDPQLGPMLAGLDWPDLSGFPVNHPGSSVSSPVWGDLTSSEDPLVVAGFASIGKIIELTADVASRHSTPRLRVLLGTEPFSSQRVTFGSTDASFDDEVRRYWFEQGVSLLLSAKIVVAIQAIDDGWLEVHFLPGRTRLHAKIYLGDDAVTVGSSNFTDAGLSRQYEANVRFERADDKARYADARLVAENYWSVSRSWSEFRNLLHEMLRFVSWREALARACADLLEGQWAAGFIGSDAAAGPLWPSQIAGIAEAMWVIENVGSVLVADATGSGKTRMGAHLARAVRDRLWSTGRARGDLTVLVCPPAVEQQWAREALRCGLTLRTVSQGLLSRPDTSGVRTQEEEVASAQILAIDEAHNFLSVQARRTAQVRSSNPEHVLMFTATPINRGAEDLLSLVDLLGADNFDDSTLTVLDQLSQRRQKVLTDSERDLLRREIQRFTVRRTKTVLNEMVERDPDAYRDQITGRVSRYPEHVLRSYPTGEGDADEALARRIRQLAATLDGVCLLGDTLEVPTGMRREYNDQQWLDLRLAAARGLAAHHVLSAMRSSTAALVEHILGTTMATELLNLSPPRKAGTSGDMLSKARATALKPPPPAGENCQPPAWLHDAELWRAHCEEEAQTYGSIADTAQQLSLAREKAKADTVLKVAASGRRVIAFDRHPITLAVLEGLLDGRGIPVVTATGSAATARRQVAREFARDATGPGIALCTDAMNEGINLQGAAAVVHLDMPTTLRVAEQRVGRVDRMDSPHDRIEVWWPDDGPAFATRADELLNARNVESSDLLGSNLPIPSRDSDRAIRPADFTPSDEVTPWDGLRDALDPVRHLVHGHQQLLTNREYEEYRLSSDRVIARVSPVRSTTPWAFFAVAGSRHGAPRWLLLEADTSPLVDLHDVTKRLRQLLLPDPPSTALDTTAEAWLTRFVRQGQQAEDQLLPRRDQRSLSQLLTCCDSWAETAERTGGYDTAERWRAVARLVEETGPGEPSVDRHQVASAWWQLTRPYREALRQQTRRRYTTLSDIDRTLRANPLSVEEVERVLSELLLLEPFDRRVSACILGVPPP